MLQSENLFGIVSEAMQRQVLVYRGEDGYWIAEVPSLPGCISQGKTRDEALENIKEAITGWLWAEDQKAVAALPHEPGRAPVLVAV